MNNVNNIVKTVKGHSVTTSTAIADGVQKTHKSTLELIRANIGDLEEFGRVAFESTPFETNGGIQTKEVALLNEQQATLLMTYMRNNDVVRFFKKRIVHAFYDMAKQQTRPKTSAEILVAQSQLLVEQEQRLALTEHRLDNQASAITQLKLDTRNGVPLGFISKSKAIRLYSQGMSKAIFEQVLTALNVQQQPYVHTENDRSVHTFAWKEDQISSALSLFIKDAKQHSETMCISRLLNGKRFKFIKPISNEDKALLKEGNL